MKFKRLLFSLVLVGLACSCVRVETGDVEPTIGEQMIDLVRAREVEAISDEEFKKMRRKVLTIL